LAAQDDTEAAMAMNSVSYNSRRALAPALCVSAIAFVGPDLILVLNAVSFEIFALVLSRLKPGHFGASPEHSLQGGQGRVRALESSMA
jgi:hypothetical protein